MFGVAQPRGSWKEIENQDVRSQRFPTCQITCLALLAIGMLVIGYLGTNTIVGFCGLGMVAGLLFFGGRLYAQAKKVEGAYNIITLNFDSKDKSDVEAHLQLPDYDILCLQNIRSNSLPPGFLYFGTGDCGVAWDSQKFSQINEATLKYPSGIKVKSSAITLLKDNFNETVICIGSADLGSFPFNCHENEEGALREELLKAQMWSNYGNGQIRHDLETMKVPADLYFYAGSCLNCTNEELKNRIKIFKDHSFNFSNYDDHDQTFIKTGKGVQVRLELEKTPSGPLITTVNYSYLAI